MRGEAATVRPGRVRPLAAGGGVPVAAAARGGRKRLGDPPGRAQVGEIQRSRLIAAGVRAIEELGYADATVAQITRHARVSRRTFYELFPNREACLGAALDEAIALVERELDAADLRGIAWRERIRLGLWRILVLLEREPVLARVCVVQLAYGGPEMLARREAILARLARVVDEGRLENPRPGGPTAVTAEGLVGAAFAIVQGRLLRAEGRPVVLSDLFGELIGLIVLPYLGPAAARREQLRAAPSTPTNTVGEQVLAVSVGDPLDGVAMRLTYRTTKVLEGIGEHPGASNREIAQQAGINDQGQMSKLLGRLERLGLIANESLGHAKGEPNAWSLTGRGRLVVQNIGLHRVSATRAA